LAEIRIPTFDELMNPLIKALLALGGSGSTEEIYAKTIELLALPESAVAQLHDPDKSTQT
jgi:restriction system protein